MLTLPPLDEILATAHVVALPMKVKFRGVELRELMVFSGPAGWAEFSPFLEYSDVESARWLAPMTATDWGCKKSSRCRALMPAPQNQSGCHACTVAQAKRLASTAQPRQCAWGGLGG